MTISETVFSMEILEKKALALKEKTEKLFIYGAGIYAHNIYKYLERKRIYVDGFLVTCKDRQEESKIPIIEVEKVLKENVGIILGLNSHNSRQVISYLQKNEFAMDRIIDGGRYLENGAERLGFDGDAIMEITSRIGCSINCRYCPQSTLLKAYYAEDKSRVSVMSMDTFTTCIEKIPEDVGIVFSGFAEPFLNSDSVNMMRFACEMGRKVDLFTTLEGANLEVLKEVSRLPLHYVGLHCADKYGYAQIHTSEEYYRMVEFLISCEKVDRKAPFVDMCNAQAEPDSQVAEICKGKQEICTTLFDRAGNLKAEGLIGKKELQGKLECSMCGDLTNRNVLLPDGTVLLCCMDYGLKHPIGNLLRETYREVLNSEESLKIRRGLAGDESLDILCRQCSCARVVR